MLLLDDVSLMESVEKYAIRYEFDLFGRVDRAVKPVSLQM